MVAAASLENTACTLCGQAHDPAELRGAECAKCGAPLSCEHVELAGLHCTACAGPQTSAPRPRIVVSTCVDGSLFVIVAPPRACRCGRASAFFVNRGGATCCAHCDARLNPEPS